MATSRTFDEFPAAGRRQAGTRAAALVLALALMTAPGAAHAGAFRKGMMSLFEQYRIIRMALAADSKKGVKAAAVKIQRVGKQLEAAGLVRRVPERRWILDAVMRGATRTRQVKGLAALRAAFRGMSRSLAVWATDKKPRWINVVQGATPSDIWLQRGKDLRSPYAGAAGPISARVLSGPDKHYAVGVFDDCDRQKFQFDSLQQKRRSRKMR